MMRNEVIYIIFICLGLAMATAALKVFLINISDAYIKRNREDLFNTGDALAIKCRDIGCKLTEQIQIYNNYINSLGLKQTISCSNSVVSNASNNAIKFIIKYSDITYDMFSLERLDFCSTFMRNRDSLCNDMDELYEHVKSKLPFYVRLFATKQEVPYTICGVDYKLALVENPIFCFSYVSPAGKSKHNYEINISAEIMNNLLKNVSSKISKQGYATIQRNSKTNDLREAIKKRDNYTCCICGNSVFKEPNLLLEVDHIIPISKGGTTTASNLQTLCWRCNREKGNSIIGQDH